MKALLADLIEGGLSAQNGLLGPPGVAASLHESLPEMFTVTRLAITGAPAKTPTTSNSIKSMFSVARRVNKNVTR